VLVLGRRVGEGIMIGHDVKVTVLVVAGDKVRIGIDAPQEIEVHREEVYLEIQQANLQAASTSTDGVAELTAALKDQASGGATGASGSAAR
jgi:carbon storage regulator